MRIKTYSLKNTLAVASVSLAGLLLLVSPLLTKNHIYTKIISGGDFASHLRAITAVANGDSPAYVPYLGESIFARVLGWISLLFHIEPTTVFWGFLIISILAIGFSMFNFGKLLGGTSTAWLALLITMLCTTTILEYYSGAIIYSVINMFLILPWAIMAISYWYAYKKKVYLICGLASFALFSGFHLTSLYLPYWAAAFLAALTVWGLIKKNIWDQILKASLLIITILGINLIITQLSFKPTTLSFLNDGGGERLTIAINRLNWNYLTLAWDYIYYTIMRYIKLATFIIGFFSLPLLLYYRKKVFLNLETQITLFALTIIGGVLLVGAVLKFSPNPDRQQLDSAGIIAMIVAILLGQLLKIEFTGRKLLAFISVGIIVAGSFSTIQNWLFI